MNVRRTVPQQSLTMRIKRAGQLLGGVLLVGLAVSLAGGLIAGGVVAYQWLDKPIEVIGVKGQFKHIQQGELEALVAPVIDGGIVSLDLTRIDQQLETHVWIKQASVSRQWPNGIVIEVKEEVPIARWGQQGFLNSQGEFLDLADNSNLKQLPLLVGPSGRELTVMKRYREIAQLMLGHQLKMTEVNVDEVGFWQIKLQSGPDLVLGSDEVMNKVRRFLVVWEGVLKHQVEQLAAIDLRYDNGLAVKWKEPQTKQQIEQKKEVRG